MEKKKRILFCGVALTKFSGLGYVASNFMRRFQEDGYEVGYATLVGKDTVIEQIPTWNDEFGDSLDDIKFYNCQLEFSEERFFLFDSIVDEFNPDIVISFLDPWQLDQIEKCAYRDSYFWLCYLTIETPHYPQYIMYPTPYYNVPRKDIIHILNNADLIVPVTQMGKSALEELKVTSVHTDNVYNGIDFTKVSDKIPFKQEIFGGVVEETDFIFMTMGKNMERKKLDCVIKAFDKFLNNFNRDTKYKLYLHTDIDNVGSGGTDLFQLILNLKIAPHILLPISFKQGTTLSTTNLYKRYQVCDCYLSLSSGEGFNYGTSEALANKLPVVYIDYGGHKEYLKNIGLPVNVKTTYCASNACMEWAIADIDHAAKQMSRAVSESKWRETIVEKGYTYAKENFDWEIVYTKLKTILEEKFVDFRRPKIFDFTIKRII